MVAAFPPADIAIECIGDLLSGNLQRLRLAPLVQASGLEPAREPDKHAIVRLCFMTPPRIVRSRRALLRTSGWRFYFFAR